ncbi:hypothetical protein G3I44_08235 [Halogeometricum borinquense]|uniref:Uncharacterized protein n=1 Tax=Halogeometricum borinquense TaxID=60847 RepID=A0A6C0UFN2_9EURY|nr:hypothetical protein [Halogeometricum borinquense]QIB74274.1 hypothetical protein G3I44_08235 [Halogeometricum borinquense]
MGIQRLSDSAVHVQRLGFGSLFSRTSSESSSGDDNSLTFRSFADGGLGETIATLIQNQQKIIEQLGGQLGDGGPTGVAEMGIQEAVKVTAGGALAEGMPENPGDVADAVPTNLQEAESLITDIAGESADLIINAVEKMSNPRQLQSVAGDVLAQGGGEAFQFMWSNAPKVAAAMILAYALHKTGGGLVKALKQGSADIASKIKSLLGSSKAESRAEDEIIPDDTKF